MPAEQPAAGTPTAIEAAAGQTFVITLDSNPSTGYRWSLDEPLDEQVVRLVGSEYQAPAANLPGAGGAEVWTFRAVAPGAARVALSYARSWERDTPPAETREYAVTVR